MWQVWRSQSWDPFLALPTPTLKYGREKKPNHQPVCHCQDSGLTKTQETRWKAKKNEGSYITHDPTELVKMFLEWEE